MFSAGCAEVLPTPAGVELKYLLECTTSTFNPAEGSERRRKTGKVILESPNKSSVSSPPDGGRGNQLFIFVCLLSRENNNNGEDLRRDGKKKLKAFERPFHRKRRIDSSFKVLLFPIDDV